MSDDHFTKLFKYMQDEFGKVRTDIEKVNAEVDRVYGLLDADLKRRETDEQERAAVNHQLKRHHGWFVQLAKRTNTKLVPEP